MTTVVLFGSSGKGQMLDSQIITKKLNVMLVPSCFASSAS